MLGEQAIQFSGCALGVYQELIASITAPSPRYVPLMALFPAKCRTTSSEKHSLMTSRSPLFHASKVRHAVAAFGCSVTAGLQARCPRVHVHSAKALPRYDQKALTAS